MLQPERGIPFLLSPLEEMNDYFKSTLHRVVKPSKVQDDDTLLSFPPRYSIAYFCNPNFEVMNMIKTLPCCITEKTGGTVNMYEDIKSFDYLV